MDILIQILKTRMFELDFPTVMTLILGNSALIIPLFLWNRSEARADIRHMDLKIEATRELVQAIHDEMKDFHGRLCAIEERNYRNRRK